MSGKEGKRLTGRDRVQIRDLLARYAIAIDEGRIEDLLAIVTDDVVLEGPLSGRHVGTEGVTSWLGAVPDRPPGQDRHFLSNLRVSGRRSSARLDAYFLHFRTVTPPGRKAAVTKLAYCGRYECDVRKQGGKWRISRRRAVLDSVPDPPTS